MSRLVYVNGHYVSQQNAQVSIFDRGFLFGDGVYEVIPVVNSRLVEASHALMRLERSLDAIDLAWPCGRTELAQMLDELRERNALAEGYVYLQVTRGVAERDFVFPADTPSTLVAYTTPKSILANPLAADGVKVVSVPDLRWKRRDIKSVNLLAQCLAKQQAALQGAFEAWMHEDGYVTEGASSSSFIVVNDAIITRALSSSILPGIRRKVVLNIAEEHNIRLIERSFTLQEAYAADEAFLSSATTLVMPVVEIDGRPVADGKPGPLSRILREMYIELIMQEIAA
jgi:D-alanine transaminase